MIEMEQAEECFIGMMLADEDIAATLEVYPQREWFKNKMLGKISDAIQKSNSIDPLEISNLCGVPHLEIVKLQVNAPISHNPNAYANQIYNQHKGRMIIQTAKKWIDHCTYNKDFFDETDSDMNRLQQISGGVHEVVFTKQLLDEWITDKEKRICGEIKPVPSGFPSLDRMFSGGLHRGDLVTVAGRPGSGKSSFLKSGLINMFKGKPETKAAIFSIEMSPNEYLDRMCSEWTGVPGTKLREAVHLTESDLDAVMEFTRSFHDKNFSFNRVQSCTVYDIVRLAKAAKLRMHGLDVILVDHLHIIKNHNSRLQERDRLAEQTITLKRLGQELDVPVVLAAQCNRQQENRPDKTPQMSDLRGGGSIEEDSNCVLFIHRPGLYDSAVDAGIAEVALRKNRHGPSPAKLVFRFDCDRTAFIEMA